MPKSEPVPPVIKAVLKSGKIPVFEATIGVKKFLYHVISKTPKVAIEVIGASPKEAADANNMVIVNRSYAPANVVKVIKKSWTAARPPLIKEKAKVFTPLPAPVVAVPQARIEALKAEEKAILKRALRKDRVRRTPAHKSRYAR